MSQAQPVDWTSLHPSTSQTRLFIRQFVRNRTAVIGLILVALMTITAVFADFITPWDPMLQVYTDTLEAPSSKHLLGTDDLGRDILSRILYGTRVSLPIGVISMGVSSIIGVILGLLAGFYGGRVDTIIMRILDAVLAFPSLLLAIFLVAILRPSLENAMIAIVVVSIPAFARVTRANILSIKEREYIEASRALGLGNWRIMLVHALPNAISPIIVQISLGIGRAILLEASLSFLGLGVQPPTPAWGSMLANGRQFITLAWWMSTFPGVAVFLSVLSFNFIGDGLREAFDPRQRRR